MVNPSYFVALALALACSTRLVSAEEDHESRMQRREAINSILGSLFESKMASRQYESDLRALPAFSKRHDRSISAPLARDRSISAPLAHPRAPISPSFHLLKVTGAKTNVGRSASDSELRSRESPDASEAAEALSRKYQYVEELRKQFQDSY